MNVLIAYGKYEGRIISDTTDSTQDGQLCVEEVKPSFTRLLPHFIASLPKYTEKDCRRMCRQMAEIIKLAHDNGLAHRSIHMHNWLLDESVCRVKNQSMINTESM